MLLFFSSIPKVSVPKTPNQKLDRKEKPKSKQKKNKNKNRTEPGTYTQL